MYLVGGQHTMEFRTVSSFTRLSGRLFVIWSENLSRARSPKIMCCRYSKLLPLALSNCAQHKGVEQTPVSYAHCSVR
jgi:hypothetical protein